jgi:hypothetical protein
MTQVVIDKLVEDLKPIPALRAAHLWGVGALIIALTAIYVVSRFGVRPEYLAMMHLTFTVNEAVYGKPLLLLWAGLACLWGVARLYRPEGQLGGTVWAFMTAPVILLLLNIARQFAEMGVIESLSRVDDYAAQCIITNFFGGLIGFGLLWALWLRKAAPARPAVFGAMAAVGVACLVAATYAIRCDRDAPTYVLVWYVLPILAVGGVAALVSRRMLRW